MNKIVVRTWGDNNGELYRVGRDGNKYYIEIITPAWEPGAGTVKRKYVSKAEALAYNPDPAGVLEYWQTKERR